MPSVEPKGENLIFVVSQPRAGSTMLQKILGAHPRIHTLSEPWIALPPLFALRNSGTAADYGWNLAQRGLEDFLHHLPEGEEAYWAGLRRMLGHLYNRALKSTGKDIFLDKTPRYYFVIPELRRLFPAAHFIFLLRNPIAVLSSILENWIQSDDPAALCDSRHDLMTAPALILDGIRAFGPGAIVARFEELASTPEPAVQRLCEQLGVTFLPSMIEYGAASGGGERWQYGDQGTVYRETRPMAERTDRWRQVIKQRPVWEAWAQSYLTALGPDIFHEFGYNYAELAAEMSASGSRVDWSAVMREAAAASISREITGVLSKRSPHEADGGGIDGEKRRPTSDKRQPATGTTTGRADDSPEPACSELSLRNLIAAVMERDTRIQELERAAAERLRALEFTEAARSMMEIAAGERAADVARLSEWLRERDARISELERGMEQRLEALQTTEVARKHFEVEAGHRVGKIAELTDMIGLRDRRVSELEGTAAERLEALERSERQCSEMHREMERRAADIEQLTKWLKERDTRIAVLERGMAERLAALEESDAARRQFEADAGERDTQIIELTEMIRQRDSRIAELERAAAERLAALETTEAARQRIEAEAGQRGAQIIELTEMIGQRDNRIAELEQGMAERLAALESTEAARQRIEAEAGQRGAQIIELTEMIGQRDNRIAELEQGMAERLAALESTEAALQRIEADAGQRGAQIIELTEMIRQQDNRIAELEQGMAERLAALERTESARRSLEIELQKRQVHLEHKDARIRELEKVAETLEKKSATTAAALADTQRHASDLSQAVTALQNEKLLAFLIRRYQPPIRRFW